MLLVGVQWKHVIRIKVTVVVIVFVCIVASTIAIGIDVFQGVRREIVIPVQNAIAVTVRVNQVTQPITVNVSRR